MPDFTRRQWTSPEAREVWGPRLNRIGAAWVEIERHSVARGIRQAGLTNIAPDALANESAWAARNGLALVPLQMQARAALYSQSMRDPRPGEAWDYRAVYILPEHAERWVEAWNALDDSEMGRMLGYPECCRSFFARVWATEGRVDTTWAMTGDPASGEADVRSVDPHNQILGRWAGYRAVPHLPCSWDCEPTREFGRTMLELGDRLGYETEMAWLREALSWPYEWSALHGIAEIRSPILRITTRTDATTDALTVRVHSDRYPAEGARGTRHPYRTWRQERKVVQIEDPSAKRNGFSSRRAMDEAHAVLIQAAAPLVGRVRSILDLGSGDGALLAKLGEALGATRLLGIEIDPERAKAVPGTVVRCASITDVATWSGRHDLIVLMPGRLLEMSGAERAEVWEAIKHSAVHVLVYAYGDWLRRGGLAELVSEATPGGAGPVVARAEAAAALYDGAGALAHAS